MKVKELIEELQKYPEDMEEAIKWLNEHRSWWDGIIY